MSWKKPRKKGSSFSSSVPSLPQKQNPPLRAALQRAFYSGPIPSAAELERYEQVCPGLADRLVNMAERQISMAESQMKHRQVLENKVISTNARLSYMGLLSGFILGGAGLGAAVYLILEGKQLGGGAAFVASLATLAGLFIYGRSRQEKHLESRLGKHP